jgi:signal transduction histidine kinase
MGEQRSPEAAVLPQVLATGTLGQAVTVQGRSVLASARRVQGYPLVVFVSTSVHDTLANSETRSGYYAVACAVATLLIAAVALLLLHLQNEATERAESLARARQRLRTLNEGLESQVRARTGELEAAYGDLEAFSYTVAHDVRAPIAAIQGFAAALAPAVEAIGDTRPTHYLKRILANAAQMSELTEALLELGKLSRAPVAATRIDLSAMAREVLAGLRERETSQRSVQATVQEGLAVQGDRVLLRQVLENLLGNAWKFSAGRSPALIRVEGSRADDGWMKIAIRDNGAGFDPAGAADLFRPFRRLHAATEFPGTGIGLATVERILRLHGGRVWIESTPEAGTSVFFTLRADAPQASLRPGASP